MRHPLFALAVVSVLFHACSGGDVGEQPIEFVHTRYADSLQVGVIRYASAQDEAAGGQPVCHSKVDVVTLSANNNTDAALTAVVDSINRYITGVFLQAPLGCSAEEAVRSYVGQQVAEFDTEVRRWFAVSYEARFGEDGAAEGDEGSVLAGYNSFDYSASSSAWLGRRDSVVCYRFCDERYSGGAHPMRWTTCTTFSLRSGRALGWRDVFGEEMREVLVQLIRQRLLDYVGVSSSDFSEFYEAFFGEVFVSDNMLLDRDSVIFHYDPYEVLPYVYGDVEVGFRYEEIGDLFRP